MANEKKPDPVNLIQRLRAASQGETVWRVMDEKTKAYCIEFTSRDSYNPEYECRQYLEEHKKRYPEHFARYVAASTVVYTHTDRLLQEAADEIDRLLKCEW